MKRQRGRNRRSGGGGNNPNRHYESNGPDVKIRGSAQQVLEKYLQYARDAHTSGDRVMSEAYFQHAEHYQRLLAAMQPRDKPRRDRDDESMDEAGEARAEDYGDDEDDGEEDEASSRANDRDERERERERERNRNRDRERNARPRQDRHEPREAAHTAGDAVGSEPDPLKVIDADDEPNVMAEETGEAASGRTRRRRPYKPRESRSDGAEAGESESDGVMKTLSRGRPRKLDTETGVEPPSVEPADE